MGLHHPIQNFWICPNDYESCFYFQIEKIRPDLILNFYNAHKPQNCHKDKMARPCRLNLICPGDWRTQGQTARVCPVAVDSSPSTERS